MRFYLLLAFVAAGIAEAGETPASSEIRCGILKKDVLTHGSLSKYSKTLERQGGKLVCAEGEHQGLGQFKLIRIVGRDKKYGED